MIRRLLITCLLVALPAAAQAPVWSPTGTGSAPYALSHSAAYLIGTVNVDTAVTTSTYFSGQALGAIVLVIKAANGNCNTGTIHGVIHGDFDFVMPFNGNPVGKTTYDIPITGLAPSTAYHACPQMGQGGSPDNFVGSTAVDFTTLALPAVHPAPPIAPVAYTPSYPNTAGYQPDVTLIGNCNVGTWNQAIFNALQRNDTSTQGTIISLPAGTFCTPGTHLPFPGVGYPNTYQIGGVDAGDGFPPGQLPSPYRQSDWHNFGSADVDTTADTIHTVAHGLSEGQEVGIGWWTGAAMPTIDFNDLGDRTTTCLQPFNHADQFHWFAHVIDADHFQLACAKPSSQGGSIADFLTAGSVNGTLQSNRMVWVPLPRTTPWIVITNGLTDAQFLPQGMRTNPTTGSLGGGFVQPYNNNSASADPRAVISIGDVGDPSDHLPLGNIWFRGIQFINQNDEVGMDPPPNSLMLTIGTANTTVVVDRCFFDNNYKNGIRVGVSIAPNGKYVSLQNNYGRNLTYWIYQYVNGIPTTGTNTLTLGSLLYAGMGPNYQIFEPNPSVVTTTGSSSGTWEAFMGNYGDLSIGLPAGMSQASCSGNPNMNCFVKDSIGGAAINSTPGAFPVSTMSGTQIGMDPVFSNTSACSTTENVFGSGGGLPYYSQSGGGPNEWGWRFTVSRPGFICAVRFFKSPNDTATARNVKLWDGSGTLLRSGATVSETASGWQSGALSSSVAVSPGQIYTASYTSPVATSYTTYVVGSNLNYGVASFIGGNTGAISQVGYYNLARTGSCAFNNPNGQWPTNFQGRVLVGPIACGTASGTSFGAPSAGQIGVGNTAFNAGNQPNYMAAYSGPGPFNMSNNLWDVTGLSFHFDASGNGLYGGGGDLSVTNNYFLTSMSRLVGGPQSDGSLYMFRQPLEYKGGVRDLIQGNIFDGSILDVSSGAFIEMTAVGTTNGAGNVTDVNINNNQFWHGNACINAPEHVDSRGNVLTIPTLRVAVKNNICWDIDGNRYFDPISGKAPRSSFLLDPNFFEDYVVDHNSVVGNAGSNTGEFISVSNGLEEGMWITNNLAQLNQSGGWWPITFLNPGSSPTNAYKNTGGFVAPSSQQLYAQAIFPYSFRLTGNVFIPGNHNPSQVFPAPGGVTAADINGWFPQGVHTADQIITANRVNATSGAVGMTNLNGIGFRNFAASTLGSRVSGNPNAYNYTPKPGTLYCSGCTEPAGDGNDAGVDYQQLNAVSGTIETVNARGTSASTAIVNYVAPNASVCTIQYSTDPQFLTGNNLFADAGGSRNRSTTLTGLATDTMYFYRLGCGPSAYSPPIGGFRTTH